MNNISEDVILKEEARKYFFISIIGLIGALPFAFFFILITGSLAGLIFPLTIWVVSLVAFIMYFIDYQVTYGMWISRKKAKDINNRSVRLGRILFTVILLGGIALAILLYFVEISIRF